jgi:hypothetical protein
MPRNSHKKEERRGAGPKNKQALNLLFGIKTPKQRTQTKPTKQSTTNQDHKKDDDQPEIQASPPAKKPAKPVLKFSSSPLDSSTSNSNDTPLPQETVLSITTEEADEERDVDLDNTEDDKKEDKSPKKARNIETQIETMRKDVSIAAKSWEHMKTIKWKIDIETSLLSFEWSLERKNIWTHFAVWCIPFAIGLISMSAFSYAFDVGDVQLDYTNIGRYIVSGLWITFACFIILQVTVIVNNHELDVKFAMNSLDRELGKKPLAPLKGKEDSTEKKEHYDALSRISTELYYKNPYVAKLAVKHILKFKSNLTNLLGDHAEDPNVLDAIKLLMMRLDATVTRRTILFWKIVFSVFTCFFGPLIEYNMSTTKEFIILVVVSFSLHVSMFYTCRRISFSPREFMRYNLQNILLSINTEQSQKDNLDSEIKPTANSFSIFSSETKTDA